MPNYKDIPGFPGYRVGDDGSVWSRMIRCYVSGKGRLGVKYVVGEPCHTKQMKPYVQKGGYLSIQLWKDGKPVHRLVHRLVLEAFVGPCPKGMECRHFPDDNKKNCNLSNLSWATKKQNQADRVFHGTHSRGENNVIAKITNAQAAEIRRRAAKGEKKAALAREFGVSRYVVSRAAIGRTYK